MLPGEIRCPGGGVRVALLLETPNVHDKDHGGVHLRDSWALEGILPAFSKLNIPRGRIHDPPSHSIMTASSQPARPWPLHGPFPSALDKVKGGKDILPPGRPSLMVVNVPPTNAFEERELQAGRGAIIVWGEVTYTDAFGHDRRTEFRYACVGNGLSEGQMTACEDGNKYT